MADRRSPPCYVRLGQLAAASLAAFISGSALEALEGHAFAVDWKRGTLVASYWVCTAPRVMR
eukprot:5515850-Prymnesium_polylepis.1